MKRLAFVAMLVTALVAAATTVWAYRPNPADIQVPPGYKIEVLATGLNTPMGVTFSKDEMFVVESGWQSPSKKKAAIQVFDMKGRHKRTLAEGKLDAMALGITYFDGALYVSGVNTILKVDPKSGRVSTVLKDLPSMGDHNVSKVQFRDGYMYFGLGSYTNSGVVGEDVAGPMLAKTVDPNTGEKGRDIPCKDIHLSGASYKTEKGKVSTSPFRPYGVTAKKGELVKGQVPCSSSVLRAPVDDPKHMELMDWGFRNPFGLAFAPKDHPILRGALLVANNGMDHRGSRPVDNSPDELHIAYGNGAFHGWPDVLGFLHASWKQGTVDVSGNVLGDNARGVKPVYDPLPMPVSNPIAVLPINSSADGMDFSRSRSFGMVNDLFISLWGQIGFAPVDLQDNAHRVVAVHFLDPAGVQITDFATNKVPGPADRTGKGGLNHPIDVRFSDDGSAMYITDFGPVDVRAFRPTDGAGVVWKVTRK